MPSGRVEPELRQVRFGGSAYETPLFQRSDLAPETALDGPLIIAEPTATTVLPPDGWHLRVDAYGLITASRLGKE